MDRPVDYRRDGRIARTGLQTTQRMATLFDDIARHSPEGVRFKRVAEERGFKAAVQDRDE